MTGLVALPLIDDFLLDYEVGHAILLMFILTLPVGYVRGSRRITAINAALFGLLFAIVPSIGGGGIAFAYLGVALLVVAPMLYAIAPR